MARILNAYEQALLELERQLLKMGDFVGNQVDLALRALKSQDPSLAQEVIKRDDVVDNWDYDLETAILDLISLQQPSREDLKTLATLLRVSKELERIGDYAVNIAEVAINLSRLGPYFKPPVDIPKMAQMAQAMLKKSLEALVNRDQEAAQEVFYADEAVDNLYKNLHQELIQYMKRGPEYVDQAYYLMLVARYLERIADRAVNIAEMVIFRETGERRAFKSRPKDPSFDLPEWLKGGL
ncbi:MAG TPA: phosphate signaling complex protein PhoU [Moorella mulderi]|nr:phosphate signaling complex protein PhoU [Moorella mulderi]